MKCKTCKHYTGYGEMCEEVLDIIEPGEVECWGYEQATNADHICTMNDDELSEWLCKALDCDFCKAYLQNMSIIYSCCENQVKGVFEWLRKPAEEET